jgi:hypothetical protein
MRRRVIAALGVVVLSTAVASALAAKPKQAAPRLDGSFEMSAVILSNDIGIPPGTETIETYAFKSTCRKGACTSVGLTRESGGRNVKSTLRQTKPGVYKGIEGPEPYVCVKPIGAPGTFTGEHKVTVTKKNKKGKATKVSDKLVIHIDGCTETIEEVVLKGKLLQ